MYCVENLRISDEQAIFPTSLLSLYLSFYSDIRPIAYMCYTLNHAIHTALCSCLPPLPALLLNNPIDRQSGPTQSANDCECPAWPNSPQHNLDYCNASSCDGTSRYAHRGRCSHRKRWMHVNNQCVGHVENASDGETDHELKN